MRLIKMFHLRFVLLSQRGCPFCSVPACSLTELVSRLNAALMNVHDLPAAIRRRSFSSSSNVQRILGIYAVISSPSAQLLQADQNRPVPGLQSSQRAFSLE